MIVTCNVRNPVGQALPDSMRIILGRPVETLGRDLGQGGEPANPLLSRAEQHRAGDAADVGFAYAGQSDQANRG